MSELPVVVGMLDRLAGQARAEGATHLLVAAIIEHDGRILLLAHGGDGFLDATWQPPTAMLFTGDTLLDVLRRSLAHTGLALGMTTGYLGHHDQDLGAELVRTFTFAVTVPDPDSICRDPTVAHLWTHADLLLVNTEPPPARLAHLLGNQTAAAREEPPLAAPLRAYARGLYPAEAAAELLIEHAAWLRRDDFTARFVHHSSGTISGTDIAIIDWPAAVTALDDGQLPCSGGEGRLLRLAASLAAGLPVDLRDVATGLDDRNVALLQQAVLHASGRRPSA